MVLCGHGCSLTTPVSGYLIGCASINQSTCKSPGAGDDITEADPIHLTINIFSTFFGG